MPAAANAATMAISLRRAPLAVSATKQMILSGLDHAGLSEAFSADYPAFVTMLDSEDAKEGTRAFLARRDPVWTGK